MLEGSFSVHELVLQDFVNVAKTNAYLLLGSAAPFLIIMSFLMVTPSPLQEPPRACLEILRHAVRCYLGSSTRGESSARRFKKCFGHVCASASGCRGCGLNVRQSMPGTLKSRVEMYAESGAGERRMCAPHFAETVYDRCAGPFTSPGRAESCFPH